MPRYWLATLITLGSVLAAQAGDWPQFLGPTRDSVSDESVVAWKSAPTVAWRQPLGDAHSSPVVAKGVVYAFFQPKKQDADALAAFDAFSGEKKWEKSYPRAKFTPPFGSGPRGTPAVSGDFIYTLGSTGILTAWKAADGAIAWQVDTLKEFKAKNLFFGISTSPTVFGDNVVVMVGGKGAGVVAFNKKDGKVAWQATDDAASYASPLVSGSGDSAQMTFLTGAHVRAFDLAGKLLWSVPFRDSLNESSTTPVLTNGLYIASSVTAGSIALDPKDASTPKTVWKDPKLTCYFSTPVAVGPHLYMVNGAASLTNASITLRCVESATGKVLWSKEKIGKYHAAMIRTYENELLMLDDTGHLSLFKPDAEGYKELAKSKVCGETWAHPALSKGHLYIRDNNELICLKLK